MTGDTDTETRPDLQRPGGLHTLAHVILWVTGGRHGHDFHDRTPELVPVRHLARLSLSLAILAWRGLR